MQILQHIDGIPGVSGEDQVADDGSASDITVGIKGTGTCLAEHLRNGFLRPFRIIRGMGKSPGKRSVHILEIRKVDIHIPLQHSKRLQTFISSAVENDGQGKPFSLCHVQSLQDGRRKMTPRHQIEIRGPGVLELQKNLRQPFP